ncbi:MAG: Sec-independent protein translocase subunit TatA/TatB [Planctomycetota bacterium]|jgi:sec-independent protein translocase protein TatA
MTLFTDNILAWVPGHWELIVILVVALLLFGRRLPDIARNIGKSMTEFKKGINEAKEAKDEVEKDIKEIKDDVVDEVSKSVQSNDLE